MSRAGESDTFGKVSSPEAGPVILTTSPADDFSLDPWWMLDGARIAFVIRSVDGSGRESPGFLSLRAFVGTMRAGHS
jgi:hypothetical protein